MLLARLTCPISPLLPKLCESFEVGTFNDLAELIQLKVRGASISLRPAAIDRNSIHDAPFQIDFAESKIQHRICIQEGIDERLDENRRMYNGLPSMLVSGTRQRRGLYVQVVLAAVGYR